MSEDAKANEAVRQSPGGRKTQLRGAVRNRPRPAPASQERGGIQSIERAVAILDVVANHPEGISLAETSAAVGLHNSTAFHLIKTLVKLGILGQIQDTKQYRVGPRLFTLAAGAMNENAMLALATPILERLSRRTGEVTHLAVRSQRDIVVIARTAATGMLQLSGQAGSTRPAHATAIGKVLLSEVPEEDRAALLETLVLQAFTERTITSKRALLRELEEVRSSGIGFDDREFDDEVRCAAVPVRDFASRCVAAIGFSAPFFRLTPTVMKRNVRELRAAAAELSSQLGATTVPPRAMRPLQKRGAS